MSEQESSNTNASTECSAENGSFVKDYDHCIYFSKRQMHLQEGLKRAAGNARTSRHRWLTWGSLVALAWMGCVIKMGPIQNARSVMPHLGMLILGSSIATTISKNAGKALDAEREAADLSKRLHLCKSGKDLVKLHQEERFFEKKYGRYYLY